MDGGFIFVDRRFVVVDGGLVVIDVNFEVVDGGEVLAEFVFIIGDLLAEFLLDEGLVFVLLLQGLLQLQDSLVVSGSSLLVLQLHDVVLRLLQEAKNLQIFPIETLDF